MPVLKLADVELSNIPKSPARCAGPVEIVLVYFPTVVGPDVAYELHLPDSLQPVVGDAELDACCPR